MVVDVNCACLPLPSLHRSTFGKCATRPTIVRLVPLLIRKFSILLSSFFPLFPIAVIDWIKIRDENWRIGERIEECVYDPRYGARSQGRTSFVLVHRQVSGGSLFPRVTSYVSAEVFHGKSGGEEEEEGEGCCCLPRRCTPASIAR